MSKVFLGSELKLNIHIDPLGEITMDSYDFVVTLYTSTSRTLKVLKTQAVRIDENNYVVLVDTTKVGAGKLKCRVEAQVPDGDFPDQLRTEIVVLETGIVIVDSAM
ncbi:MAG: hypothetical protein IIX79_05240 [Alistipes sp.]|nr:hypothetical protein [Alistipes sp.]MBQ1981068.1 hypothetical protein [Alistipes sp.]MBQ5914570.1 hypothetical protein [Alistipes sp.]